MTETQIAQGLWQPPKIPSKYEVIPIHNSDRGSFKRCRRYFDWTSPARHNLSLRADIHGVNTDLWFGTGIHWALEQYYTPGLRRDPVEAWLTWFDVQWRGGTVTEEWLDRVYDLNPRPMEHKGEHLWVVRGLEDIIPDADSLEYDELKELGIQMMTAYKKFAEMRDNFEVLVCEHDFSIPIWDYEHDTILQAVDLRKHSPNYGKVLEVHQRGRMDAIWAKPNGKLGVIDHKTSSRIDEDFFRKLETDEQVTSYLYAAQVEAKYYGLPYAGQEMEECVYNVLRKTYPKPPTMVRGGLFSVDRNNESTTWEMLEEFMIDPSLIVATDGTAEGLLSGLSNRPNQASIFFKDEVSGLFNSMTKKDYLAGFQETLTALYDVPPITTRLLRKETIIIESPAFIFLCGGVPDRIFESIDEHFVLGGFLPRFLVVSGNAHIDDRRPLGPPTHLGLSKRPHIVNKIADLYETYATPIKQNLGGQIHMATPRITARMSPEAWRFNAQLETTMLHTAQDSLVKDLALPTMDRLSRSMLKIAVIFAACRQKPKNERIMVEEMDIANAATYVQRWGPNSIDLVVSAGKGRHEKFLERIHEFVQSMPGALKSTIMKRFHLSSRDAAAILQTLEERGQIRKEPRGRGYAYWIN